MICKFQLQGQTCRASGIGQVSAWRVVQNFLVDTQLQIDGSPQAETLRDHPPAEHAELRTPAWIDNQLFDLARKLMRARSCVAQSIKALLQKEIIGSRFEYLGKRFFTLNNNRPADR